jgi:hypothetical protein
MICCTILRAAVAEQEPSALGLGNCDIQSVMNYLVYFELNQYEWSPNTDFLGW